MSHDQGFSYKYEGGSTELGPVDSDDDRIPNQGSSDDEIGDSTSRP